MPSTAANPEEEIGETAEEAVAVAVADVDVDVITAALSTAAPCGQSRDQNRRAALTVAQSRTSSAELLPSLLVAAPLSCAHAARANLSPSPSRSRTAPRVRLMTV